MSMEETRAKQFLEENGVEASDDNLFQLEVFLDAVRIYDSRTSAYGQVWKQYGALSNLLSVARKTDRLMESWWHEDSPDLHKDALDDAFDLLNYCVFFIRNAREANITGDAPERPKPKRITVTNLPDTCTQCPHTIDRHSIRGDQACLMAGCDCNGYLQRIR